MTNTDMTNAALPDARTLVAIYRKMVAIKLNDDRFISQIKAGRLVMPYYSARGQECIPAAISVLLTDADYLVTIYRGIHDMIAKGVPPKLIWAELAGRSTGSCKGKGGPMHITHPPSGCMVTTGVVGAGMPIACGLALAAQLRGEKRVTVTNFGDGASNIGAFHESLNLAAVWKLPVIFVCQNNRYAEHTSMAKGTSIERISDRARSYNMQSAHVDGNEPLAVYQAAKIAIERARSGGGPTLDRSDDVSLQRSLDRRHRRIHAQGGVSGGVGCGSLPALPELAAAEPSMRRPRNFRKSKRIRRRTWTRQWHSHSTAH